MQHKRHYFAGLTFVWIVIGWLPVQAEVDHRQINSANKITYVSDDPWQPANFENGTAIPATYMETDDITLDGRDDEPAWNRAEEIEISLNYGSTNRAYVKALYTDQDILIRVRWADDNEDRDHHPWTWDSALQRYVAGTEVEDSLMLSFEAGCEWTPSLLGGYIYDYDAWHWLAARSDPLGQALDLYGNIQDRDMSDPNFVLYQSRVKKDDWILKFTENHEVDLYAQWDDLDRAYLLQPITEALYVRGVPDGKRQPPPFVEQLPPPANKPIDESHIYPQFNPVKLTGDAGEVSAKGYWDNGFWTVEFRRVLVTPAKTQNDVVFNRLTQFSVHIFDHTERVDESSESKRLFLQFLPEESPRIAKD